MLENIFYLGLIYLGAVIFWFIFTIVAYFISIALKKEAILKSVVGLSVGAVWIISTVLGLYLLYLMFQLLISGKILLFLLMIFFGYGIISSLFGLLTMPFYFIPTYFTEKIEGVDFDEDITKGEIIDDKGNMVGVSEGESDVTIRMSRSFVVLYLVLLLGLLLFPDETQIGLMEYITIPFWQLLTSTLFVGLPYGIYRYVKFRSFFTEDKKYFFTTVWKFSSIINLIFIFVLFIISYL